MSFNLKCHFLKRSYSGILTYLFKILGREMRMDLHIENLKSNLVYRLNHSADLVDKISKYKLNDGRSLTELFTIDGVSYFDFFTAELAHVHVPQVFLSKKDDSQLFEFFFPSLLKIRDSIYEISNIFNSISQISETSVEQNSIVLLGFTNRMFVDILQPLIPKINERFNGKLIILLDNDLPATNNIFFHEAEIKHIRNFNNKNSSLFLRNIKRKLLDAAREINLNMLLLDVLPSNDLIFLIKIKNLLNRVIYGYMQNSIKYVFPVNQFISKYNPALIISPDTADSRTRLISIIAKKNSIPNLEIQFGLAGDEAVEWRFSKADKIAVWGESSQDAMLKQSVNKDKIVLTGSPRHDILFSKQFDNLNLKLPQIPANHKIILLASTYNFKDKNHADISVLKSMQLSIGNAVTNIDNIFLLIKPHPHEDVNETISFYPKSSKIYFLNKDEDIKRFIPLCDAFISYGSTATIDALIAGKLTVCPIFDGWSFSSDIFKNSGATLNPRNDLELFEIFKTISSGSHDVYLNKISNFRKLFLQHYIYRIDSKSSERIVDLSLKMFK